MVLGLWILLDGFFSDKLGNQLIPVRSLFKSDILWSTTTPSMLAVAQDPSNLRRLNLWLPRSFDSLAQTPSMKPEEAF